MFMALKEHTIQYNGVAQGYGINTLWTMIHKPHQALDTHKILVSKWVWPDINNNIKYY